MSEVTSQLTVSCQAVVSVTFALSAVAKVTGRGAYTDFRRWLRDGPRVPAAAAGPVAALAVAAEAVAAVAVLIPPLVPAAFAVAALLLAVFTASVRSMIRRRVRLPCRCFGAGRHPPGPLHLVRNSILLVLAVSGGVLALAGDGPPPAGAVWVPAAVAGGALALLLAELEELRALAAKEAP